jgi:hypothetical protein
MLSPTAARRCARSAAGNRGGWSVPSVRLRTSTATSPWQEGCSQGFPGVPGTGDAGSFSRTGDRVQVYSAIPLTILLISLVSRIPTRVQRLRRRERVVRLSRCAHGGDDGCPRVRVQGDLGVPVARLDLQ